jgi:tetratricopeptide (TPR) repeat protein
MSDGNGSNKGLGTFLNQMSALILTVISFISGIYGFVKLFADKDAGLVTLISLTVGILLLLGVCLYYARFWQPERQDQGQSAFSPMSDEQGQAQAKKERHRQWVRRLAIAGLILIPILSLSGVAGWFYVQSLPAKNIIVLVADFDGPDAKTYGVTETVIRQLRKATERYTDVEIQALNKSITEQEGSKVAQTEGKKRKATIVIWGWYRNPGEVVPLSVHFEVLRPPKELPELGQAARGNIQQAAVADLKSFTLQTRLSNEMTYLSLFTLGVSRYAAADLDGAISRFNDALSQLVERTSVLDQSLVYLYRGSAYLQKDDYERAFADLDQSIKLQPDFAPAYIKRGIAYFFTGELDRALADYTQALRLQPDFALTYGVRCELYQKKEDYEHAITDCSQSLKLQPDARAYHARGAAYALKGEYDRALADYTQALKLKPSLDVAADVYRNRGAAYNAKGDYNQAIADYNQLLKLQPNNAKAYNGRGWAYALKGDYERALADVNQALKFQPDDPSFYDSRGFAYSGQGNYDRAIADYNQALKLKPDADYAYYHRGVVYRALGDHQKAIADFKRTLELTKNSKRRQDAEKQLQEIGAI